VGSAGQLAARRQRVAGSGSDGGTETAGSGRGSQATGSGTSSEKRKIEELNLKLAEYQMEIKRMKTDREKIKRDADKRVAAAEKRAEATLAKLHNENARDTHRRQEVHAVFPTKSGRRCRFDDGEGMDV
jgi:molecular chaperone GrpE (heat shock protein)